MILSVVNDIGFNYLNKLSVFTLRRAIIMRYMMSVQSFFMDAFELMWRGYAHYRPIERSQTSHKLRYNPFHISRIDPEIVTVAHPSVDRQKEWLPRYTFHQHLASRVIPVSSFIIATTLTNSVKLFLGFIHHIDFLTNVLESIFGQLGETFGHLMFTYKIKDLISFIPDYKGLHGLLKSGFAWGCGVMTNKYILKYIWPYKDKVPCMYPTMPVYDRAVEKTKYEDRLHDEKLQKEAEKKRFAELIESKKKKQ